jgi:hypothetical protein
MKFKDLYVAIKNHRVSELNHYDIISCVARQTQNLEQQRAALKACVYNRKRYISGRTCKYRTEESSGGKPGPWFEHIESPRVLARLSLVSELSDRLDLVIKQLHLYPSPRLKASTKPVQVHMSL